MTTPLSDEELKALRSLILADARRQWVVSGIKAVSTYVAILAAGYLAFKGMVGDFLGWGGR